MTGKFPADAPKRKAIRALELLGFRVVREKEHVSMVRENPDGTKTPLTMPNHPNIKAATLEENLHSGRYFQGRVSECLPEGLTGSEAHEPVVSVLADAF